MARTLGRGDDVVLTAKDGGRSAIGQPYYPADFTMTERLSNWFASAVQRREILVSTAAWRAELAGSAQFWVLISRRMKTMRVVVWATLIVALPSTVSFAEPPLFLPGRYVLPVMAHDLYVSPPGQPGTTVTVNFRFKPIRACTDTLDSVLVYQLPPDYSSAPINEVSATCNKTIRCGGMEFRCIGAKQPYPMTFRPVPSRNIKASGDSFSGTYKYVSESIPRPRAALLRRASIGNFETVEESTDNTRSVRFRMGQ